MDSPKHVKACHERTTDICSGCPRDYILLRLDQAGPGYLAGLLLSATSQYLAEE